MNKMFMTLLLGIFLFTLVLAGNHLEQVGFDWDNRAEFRQDQDTSRYGRYEIRNSVLGIPFWLLGRVVDIELINNTDICSNDCRAVKEFTLYNDGVLVSDISFRTLQDDGSWVEQAVRNYQLSYQGEIQDYKTVCAPDTTPNGTIFNFCSQVEDGTHRGKINYKIGEVIEAGSYTLTLEAEKRSTRTIDWRIESNGIWTNEWSVWGAGAITEEVAGSFTAGSTITDRNGINITATTNFTLVSVNITQGAEVTRAYLYFSNGTQIGSFVSFVGSRAIFNEDLISGLTYYVVTDNAGASYLRNGSVALGPTFNSLTMNGLIFQSPPSTFGTSTDNPIQFIEINDTLSNVQLNSPANNTISPISEVKFNATAIVIGGATLVNMSLYTNETGTFEARNTRIFGGIGSGLPFGDFTSGLQSGNIRYFKMDNDSMIEEFSGLGDVTDTSTNTTGKILSGRDYESGSNQFTNYGDNFEVTGSEATWNAWVKMETIAGSQMVVSKDNTGARSFAMGITNGILNAGIGSQAISGTTTLPTGVFVMVTYVWDDTTNNMSVYVNGTFDGSGTMTSSLSDVTAQFQLGARQFGGGGDFFDGVIDEVGIWDRKLTETEIQSLFGEGLSESTQTFNRTINGSTLWNFRACDSDGDCGFGINNRTVISDITPPQITIEIPKGLLDFGAIGKSQILNVTFLDSNLDVCLFNYNGTNVTIDGCISGIKNSTSFIFQEDNFNLTVFANDTAGNANSSFTNWTYKVLLNSQTFNTNTTEGNTESFEANITLLNGLSVSVALLVYNGTATVGTATVQGNQTILSVNDVVIPGVAVDTNLSFFWAILLSDATAINFTVENQTVFALGIDNCSSFSNKIITFTNVNEEFQTLLPNSTIETAVNIFAEGGTVLVLNLSGSFVTNPTSICLNIPLTNESNYLMNVIVKYSAVGFAIEYFNIVDFVLNLDTSDQNITLFDLNLSDSTDFQLTFTGADFIAVENVLVFVERQFISENTFKTVELPQTDANGQTILHLVRNDIIYNFRFVKDGQILGVFENIIAFCDDFTIGRCVLDLSAINNESAFENYDEVTGITYTNAPTFDSSTNTVSFSFVSQDGATKTAIMRVERRDIFGNQSVCNNTIISSSGTLSCNIGLNLSDTTLFTIISVDGNDLVFNTVVIDNTSFGDIGYALWFILTLVLILMASDSKNGIILVTLISYLGALSMGWVLGGAIGVGSSGVWVLIITSAAIWQINKKRVS